MLVSLQEANKSIGIIPKRARFLNMIANDFIKRLLLAGNDDPVTFIFLPQHGSRVPWLKDSGLSLTPATSPDSSNLHIVQINECAVAGLILLFPHGCPTFQCLFPAEVCCLCLVGDRDSGMGCPWLPGKTSGGFSRLQQLGELGGGDSEDRAGTGPTGHPNHGGRHRLCRL